MEIVENWCNFFAAKECSELSLFDTIATLSVPAFAMMAALGVFIALLTTAAELRRSL
jgi:hypothetical protein